MGRAVSKNELELERIKAGGRRFTKRCDLFKGLMKYGCFAFCFWLLGNMIRDLAHGDPAAMDALCGVLKAIRAPQIVHAILTVLLGGGYAVEKSRNRRLVNKCGDNRHKKEHNDPVNSRSGLDRNGVAEDE